MKYRDWFIAGISVALGISVLMAASTGMQPMGMHMGLMMVGMMVVPWLLVLALFVLLLFFGGKAIANYLRGSTKHDCPDCGRQVHSDWKVCPYCGTYLAKRDD